MGHMVALFLAFEEPSYSFPQWLHQFTFPPAVYKGSFFSTSLPTFLICVLIDDSHFDRCEMTSHCGFYMHFSNN